MRAVYHHDLRNEQCRIGHSLAYMLHFHHKVELVYMFEGNGTAYVDGREYKLVPGDVLVVFPNQIHEYKIGENETFFLALFKPEKLPDFKDFFYNMQPVSNLYHNEDDSFFPELARKLPEVASSDNVYKDQINKGLLSAFIGELFSKMSFEKVRPADLSMVKAMLTYCNENYLTDISLEKAAKHLLVSKYYLSHVLNEKLNISFNDYINSLRVADSISLLEEGGHSMTEIAQKCGFNTVRTFNRAFKGIYGFSPGKYKKMTATD